MEKQMIKTFEDKKETARILRNVFIVAAVVYVGLIIWSLCLHKYVPALFDAVILLMDIGYVYWCKESMSDAELALKYIEYVESRDELIESISRNHPWISVNDKLPGENPDNKGYSVEVIGLFSDGSVCKWYCSIEERIWFMGIITTDQPTHWMPIPEVL